MIDNQWLLLEKRLRAIARNQANGGCDGVARINLFLYLDEVGHLLGWQKPERIPYEPKQFPVRLLRLQSVNGWYSAIEYIKQQRLKNEVSLSLVVCDGNPRGYLY